MEVFQAKSNNVIQAIERVVWEQHTLKIEGYAYLDDSNIQGKHPVVKNAYLIDLSTGKKLRPVRVHNSERSDISFVYGNESNLNWSGYSICVDFDNGEVPMLSEGSYAIGMEYETNKKRICSFYLGKPIKGVLSELPNQYINRSMVGVSEAGGKVGLVLNIIAVRAVINDVIHLPNDVQLTGWINDTDNYNEVLVQNGKEDIDVAIPLVMQGNSETGNRLFHVSISKDVLNQLVESDELSVCLSGPHGKIPLFYNQDNVSAEVLNGEGILFKNKGNKGFAIVKSSCTPAILSNVKWEGSQVELNIIYPTLQVKNISGLVLEHSGCQKVMEFDVHVSQSGENSCVLKAIIDLQNRDNHIPLNIGDWSICLKDSSNQESASLIPLVYDLENTVVTKKNYLQYGFRKNADGTSKLVVEHSVGRRLNPKISVILPVYNVEDYLEECLDSLVRQSMRDFEVIMVDDGSSDNSRDIMERYSKVYRNFIPIYKENGGLGHARNYGVSYASGDYLIFMDSDDYIADKAYELLYNSAKNTGSDIVVGNVRRFNSSREFASGLHRKVFKETILGTHITKNQELIYDTTAWNKLYKKSFWDKHQFKFPEGILYEDIPVTIPAHFLSESTDILSNVIYYWRARDGVNKSITQQRDQLKNFTDRLDVMKMVDSFFDNQPINQQLKIDKDYKALNVDILLYLNTLDEVDDEYKEVFIESVSNYLKRVDPAAIERLNAIDRLKYNFIKEKKLDQLLEVLQFQKQAMRTTRIKKDGDRYYGDYPFKDILPKHLFDVTDELQVQRELGLVRWKQSKLIMSGYAYIDKVDMKRKSAVKMEAYITNPTTNDKVPVQVEVVKRTDVTHKKGIDIKSALPLKRLYNYHWSGFNIVIDFDNPEIANLGVGKLEVWLTLAVGSIKRTFRVGGPVAGKKPRPGFGVTKKQRIFPKYNAAWDLVIETSSVFSVINSITQREDKLHIEGWTELPIDETKVVMIDWATNIRKSYSTRPITVQEKDEEQIAGDREKNGFEADISLSELNIHNSTRDWSAYLYRGKERYPLTLMSKAKDLPPFIDGTLETEISMNPAGNMNIEYKNIAPCLEVCTLETGKLYMEINVHKNLLPQIDAYEMTCYLKSRINGMQHTLSISKREMQGDYMIVGCELDILKNGIAILEPGRWDLYMMYGDARSSALTRRRVKVKESLSMLNSEHIISGLKITPYNTDEGNFSFNVLLHWNKIERGPRRQEVIRKVLYPLFRMLPMKKKTVVFESYWGKSYSCNPRALYQYMSKEYKDYEFVWFFRNENTYVDGDAKRVRMNSIQYYYYLARAKYFINNANFPDFYEKRQGAVEIQTLHGTPLKTMGLDVPGETDTQEKLENFLRRCNRWDYLVSPSGYVSIISKRAFKFDRKLLECGFPRNDMLKRNWTEAEINEIKDRFNIPLNKKIVMYAPTWRVKKGFQLELNLDKMKKALGDEYIVLLRLHYFVSSSINVDKYKGFVYDLSSHNDIQELYLLADILITDYSSVMFDYANLNRPILFFTYDLEAYRDNLRGLYIDFEAEAPGPLLRDTDEVIKAITEIDRVQAEYMLKFERFKEKFCQFDKGNATQLVIEHMLNHKKAN